MARFLMIDELIRRKTEEKFMTTLKRIYISLKSRIDQVADDFENHEALAGAAIKELEAAGSSTRVQLHRLNRLVRQYEERLTDLENQARRWSERAVQIREKDEEKALRCVKRLRETRHAIERIEQLREETRRQEAKTRADREAIETKLQALKNKKALLAARQTHGLAHAAIHSGEEMGGEDPEAIFQRWEETVAGAECGFRESDAVDGLEAEFREKEDARDLRAMLDELVAQRSDSGTS